MGVILKAVVVWCPIAMIGYTVVGDFEIATFFGGLTLLGMVSHQVGRRGDS